jgi:hypothetical protein
MRRPEDDQGRLTVEGQRQVKMSRFSGTGEPRSGEVAITVLTALILLIVLAVLAVL